MNRCPEIFADDFQCLDTAGHEGAHEFDINGSPLMDFVGAWVSEHHDELDDVRDDPDHSCRWCPHAKTGQGLA